jgi:hypothetical protein
MIKRMLRAPSGTAGLAFALMRRKNRNGVCVMADNRRNRGGPAPSRVAAGQGYELGYFARKHGLSREQARSLIERIGNDRAKLNAAAAKLKG